MDAVVCKIKISAKMHDEQNVTILNKDKIVDRAEIREKSVRLILPNVDT